MPATRDPILGTRVPPDLDHAFRLAARAEGQTVSGALRLAILRYVEAASAAVETNREAPRA